MIKKIFNVLKSINNILTIFKNLPNCILLIDVEFIFNFFL